jgi:predicted membrane protein
MNEYQRNTGMVVCILAVLIGGAVVVGVLSFYGPGSWFIGPGETVYYSFDEVVGTTSGLVTLDVGLTGGSVNIEFVENSTLLYSIDIAVDNRTVQEKGAPAVTFASNTIAYQYTAGAVNITLGSGANYTLDITTTAGSVVCKVTRGANVSDISIKTDAGTIEFSINDDAAIIGNPNFTFETNAGEIEIDLDLAAGIGGSVQAEVGLGTVEIDAPGWIEVNSRHYESSDYASAFQSITVAASTDLGTIDIEVH